MKKRNVTAVPMLMVLALAISACAESAQAPAEGNPDADTSSGVTDTVDSAMTMSDAAEGASVSIDTPEDGATVTSPVEVCMSVEGLTLAPKETMDPGTGHLHILVDPSGDEMADIGAGTSMVILDDETHIHLGDASTCRELELEPGDHVLMAVVADGAHMNMNPAVTDQVAITVE